MTITQTYSAVIYSTAGYRPFVHWYWNTFAADGVREQYK
jgi:hypothetical protein